MADRVAGSRYGKTGPRLRRGSDRSHDPLSLLPQQSTLTIRLLGERGSGRLLGGQIVGGPGAGKRIDIVATALHAGMTAEDMLDLTWPTRPLRARLGAHADRSARTY